MLVRSVRRVAFALAAISLVFALPAASADDPVAFAKALYALPGKWADVAENSAARAKYLTPQFGAVVDENGKYSDELDYAVDYDPLTQSQDWDLKDVKYTLEQSSSDAATVRVEFTNFDRHDTVHLDLAKISAGWRLADLKNGEGASLLKEYMDLNIAGRAVKAGN